MTTSNMDQPAPPWKVFAVVSLAIFCGGSAAYYGIAGLPKGPEKFTCDLLHFVNDELCVTANPPNAQTGYQMVNQLEGYLQAIYVSLLTWLAFLVHEIKQPKNTDKKKKNKKEGNIHDADKATASLNSFDLQQDHPKEPEPTKSKNRISKRIANFLTAPNICVWVLLIAPTIIFVAATINHGEQGLAVFVMALVAIYVAAEHYSSLERQGNIVRRQERATDNLERQLGSLSNALGTSYSQQVIFRSYAKTANEMPSAAVQRGIYAIYKYPDIDSKWWSSDVKDVWEKYFAIKGDTLFDSIREGRRKKILFVVTDVPLKLSPKKGDGGMKFAKFIGLAWYWVCLNEAAKKVEGAEYDIMVANTSNWIHVVDNQVFQLIGTPPDSLRVRDLNFDINVIAYDEDESVSGAEEAGKNLVNWAISNIERLAERGTSAEEYLRSVLMYSFIQRGWEGDHEIDLSGIKSLLPVLGLQAWLDRRPPDCPPYLAGVAPDLCASILYEFMKRHKQQNESQPAEGPKPTDFGLELQ
ncbi:hypothetical protein IQ288_34670 [Burkholderia sp. R-69980]|jgi:hypothetical protein|nr:hypothetical protein [Burkholderia sp. R-69980]